VVDLPITGETSTLGAYLEYSHIISYYTSSSVFNTRQVAQVRNVAFFTPFTNRRMSSRALNIPTPERYIDDLRQKHILKSLLKERVPGYNTEKNPAGGDLPKKRWMSDGPLSKGFVKYGLPNHIPEEMKSDMLDNPQVSSWKALCFKIWKEKIFSDPKLEIGSNAEQISL